MITVSQREFGPMLLAKCLTAGIEHPCRRFTHRMLQVRSHVLSHNQHICNLSTFILSYTDFALKDRVQAGFVLIEDGWSSVEYKPEDEGAEGIAKNSYRLGYHVKGPLPVHRLVLYNITHDASYIIIADGDEAADDEDDEDDANMHRIEAHADQLLTQPQIGATWKFKKCFKAQREEYEPRLRTGDVPGQDGPLVMLFVYEAPDGTIIDVSSTRMLLWAGGLTQYIQTAHRRQDSYLRRGRSP
jgi:hypothetical protein